MKKNGARGWEWRTGAVRGEWVCKGMAHRGKVGWRKGTEELGREETRRGKENEGAASGTAGKIGSWWEMHFPTMITWVFWDDLRLAANNYTLKCQFLPCSRVRRTTEIQ